MHLGCRCLLDWDVDTGFAARSYFIFIMKSLWTSVSIWGQIYLFRAYLCNANEMSTSCTRLARLSCSLKTILNYSRVFRADTVCNCFPLIPLQCSVDHKSSFPVTVPGPSGPGPTCLWWPRNYHCSCIADRENVQRPSQFLFPAREFAFIRGIRHEIISLGPTVYSA
jgi:hypothetical protein